MSPFNRPDFENGTLLLVDCEARTLNSLEKSLQRLGIQAQPLLEDAPQNLQGCFAAIVELEHFASPKTLLELAKANVPVVALTPHETLSQIQRAIELGATALLNRPITQGSVYTTLMMAIGLRERLDRDAQTIDHLQQRLANRPQLAMALARLMVEHGLDESAAYERLRELSMRLNRSIDELCAELAADHGQQRGGLQ
ncbi:AmiR/NasT family two-component response regulator [Pseudomonas sp. TE3786]